MSPHARVAVWPSLLSSTLLAVVGADGCASSAPTGSGDASVPDVTADDAGSGAAFPAPDASACRPGDVETYQPSTYHFAAAAWRGVCVIEGPTGNGQDRLFFDKCLAPDATPEGCGVFQSDLANAECAKCILTPASTASHDGYGPLINYGTFITTNVAGCVELTDPSALSCAKAVQALGGCELRACEANCPVHDQASRAAYDTCASHADRAGCQPYDTAAACLAQEAASAPSCLLPAFADFYYAVVPLFCGVPPKRDAGVAALGVDASEEDFVEASATPPADALTDALADARVDMAVDARGDAVIDAKPIDAAGDGRTVATALDASPGDAGADALSDAAKD